MMLTTHYITKLARYVVACLLFFLTHLFTAGVNAGDYRVAGPFLHEESGRYFELRRTDSENPNERNWNNTKKRAESLVFKDKTGRLAVIDRQDIGQFLLKKFPIRYETWIGLRYFCGTHNLTWINNKEQKRPSVIPWNPQWYRDASTTCFSSSPGPYMAVYLRPDWTLQAVGPVKHLGYYLVEY